MVFNSEQKADHPRPDEKLDVVTVPRRDWVQLGEVIEKARALCRRIADLEFNRVSLKEYLSIQTEAATLLGDGEIDRPTDKSLLADLVDQIDKGEYIDHYGHRLNMNVAFQRAKARIRGES